MPNLRVLIIGLAIAVTGFTADPPKPATPKAVSKEIQAELKLVAKDQAEREAKIKEVYVLLMTPVEQTKQALFERACQEGGVAIAECELDSKAWTVSKRAAPAKEK